MWPGMRPATGMDGELDFDAALAEFIGKFAHLMLRLRHGHAVTGHDDDPLRVAEQQRGFVGLNRFDRSRRHRQPPPAPPPPEPNAPNKTLVTGRFIALHMSSVSSVPDEPTSVPATIIERLLMVKPSAATARPVNEFNSEMTTGMSAPPMGMTIATPKTSASANITMNAVVLVVRPADQITAQAEDDEQDEAVQNVLAGERVRLFKFSLQLQKRDDAAGKRQRTDERGEQHRAPQKNVVMPSWLADRA